MRHARWSLTRCFGSPCSRVPAAEATLRAGLIEGDLHLVEKALRKGTGGARSCMSSGAPPAKMDFAYRDDAESGRPARSLEYLCQGSRMKETRRPRSVRRAQASDIRRAEVLRYFFTDAELAGHVWEQLELAAAEAFQAAPDPEALRSRGGEGALASGVLTLARSRPTALHRCAYTGSCEVLATLRETMAWCGWEVHAGPRPTQGAPWSLEAPDASVSGHVLEAPASWTPGMCALAGDLRQCRRHCLELGYGGFAVRGGLAYFIPAQPSVVEGLSILESGTTLYVAPGPHDRVSRMAVAALLLGQDQRGESPLDVALRRGDVECAVLLARMGSLEALHAEKRELSVMDRILYGGLPQWFARAVALPGQILAGISGAARRVAGTGTGAEDYGNLVFQGAEQIRGRVLNDRAQVMEATGVSAAVAEALLRHYGHSPEAAIGAFRADPQGATTAAKVPLEAGEVDVQVPDPAAAQEALQCGVCFGDLPAEPSTPPRRHLLPCGGRAHPFCDDCLQRYVEGRLEEGDVRGLVCPDPSCRLPLAEEAVEGICGAAARARFVQLAASQAVDAAAHLSWCPMPGCGRAVARSEGMAATCGCGFTFCSACREPGGHEPASCQGWAAWKQEFPEEES